MEDLKCIPGKIEIIINDDDDDDDDDDDLVIVKTSNTLESSHGFEVPPFVQQKPYSSSNPEIPSLMPLLIKENNPRTPASACPVTKRAPKKSCSHNRSICQNTNRGATKSSSRQDMSSAENSSQYRSELPLRLGISGFLNPFGLSSPLIPFSSHAGPGSALKPIELDEQDDLCDIGCINPEQAEDSSTNSDSDSISLGDNDGAHGNFRAAGQKEEVEEVEEELIIDLTSTVNISDNGLITQCSMRRFSMADSEVIELEDWEELKDAIPNGVEVICLEDVYHEDVKPPRTKSASRAPRFERRNQSISEPFTTCESYQLKEIGVLRRNKTVELREGGFLRIKDIIQNTQTKNVKLRGHRLERARYLNGLLAFKVNEIVLCLEVDLDDPRDPLEQGAVEVPIEEVVKLRHARFTNQKFPDCRLVNMGEYRNNTEACELGGLTVRWKYTCKYETAANRYHNIFKERTLERIRPEECPQMYALPDETRRFQWRGETIRGGSWRPMVDDEKVHKLPTEEEFLKQEEDDSKVCKRKLSDNFEEIDAWVAKKRRHRMIEEGEDTRRRFSNVHLADGRPKEKIIMDLCCSDPDTKELLPASQPNRDSSFQQSIPSAAQIIDLNDILSTPTPSTPPPIRNIRPPESSPAFIHRSANQTFTYGDAFCGAGGSTRGALLAGLRPKWGFDFNTHACLSWRTNFPFAVCYNTDAHNFISQASSPLHPSVLKVDILHLSPPCQYFSPAHTVEGVDDEQNVASLFAVEECIKVARPRVVTLEQTFGIACGRFRFYFNALIQMFTSQDFSVRWAVVPLAQWGLPQRRNRLIIIASCPGEILPRMPVPTHSSTDPSLTPLVSVSSTLSSIPQGAPDHDPNSPSLQFLPHRQMPPWDGSKILPRAMTTSGGQNYHPSGKRDFTLREYGCLQGFPLEHVFRGNYVKKQIGNAVPPCVAKVLFESIKKDLDLADGVVDGVEIID